MSILFLLLKFCKPKFAMTVSHTTDGYNNQSRKKSHPGCFYLFKFYLYLYLYILITFIVPVAKVLKQKFMSKHFHVFSVLFFCICKSYFFFLPSFSVKQLNL